MSKVRVVIPDYVYSSFHGSVVPWQIKLRIYLNNHGIKFKGDGTPAAATTDLNPVPLGKTISWHDDKTGDTVFEQELEGD